MQLALDPGEKFGGGDACLTTFNRCLATGNRLYDLGYVDEAHQQYLGCRNALAACYENETLAQSSPLYSEIDTYFPPNKAQNGGGYVSHAKGIAPVYIPPSVDPLAGWLPKKP
ncbi:hypothetical protein [Methylocapsa sp. S129]|uniref:hypothetical protein n=1 Tax=Methylocapsa sp. S129 TaxID=1641869 RepID=UPI00131C54DC|nr:hypothetical protein [Methylocapsa sp. S129]